MRPLGAVDLFSFVRPLRGNMAMAGTVGLQNLLFLLGVCLLGNSRHTADAQGNEMKLGIYWNYNIYQSLCITNEIVMCLSEKG